MHVFIAFSAILACTAATTTTGFITPIAAFAAPLSSQYHAQDTLGQYTYGYTNPLSAKSEARSIDGSVLGSYSYVDPNGKIQSVEYAADQGGFRVAASNLPVAPVAAEIPTLAVPVPVQDTPEVIEARNQHFAAVEEAKNRAVNEAVQTEVGNSVDIPAARSAIALKYGETPVAISSSIPITAQYLPVAYRPTVAVKSFVTPAIAVKSSPASTAFSYSYGIDGLYNYAPAIYYPGYTTFASHFATHQPDVNVVGDAAIVENAELAIKERSEEKGEKRSQ
ncbi:unnamed protein product [Phyllotreta striolata]|uniref:Cuticle protein 6 n=1 Tax=Phyllotreta striolata TaxID=444603 RepID=A0A9N9TVF5_PHYSR|nr:unnamed protein product [Phyllotreta striolata]